MHVNGVCMNNLKSQVCFFPWFLFQCQQLIINRNTIECNNQQRLTKLNEC